MYVYMHCCHVYAGMRHRHCARVRLLLDRLPPHGCHGRNNSTLTRCYSQQWLQREDVKRLQSVYFKRSTSSLPRPVVRENGVCAACIMPRIGAPPWMYTYIAWMYEVKLGSPTYLKHGESCLHDCRTPASKPRNRNRSMNMKNGTTRIKT